MEFTYPNGDGAPDLSNGNNKEIENKIIEFILHLKKEGYSYGAINNYLSPIKLYYGINDVVLNIKKIDRFLPEQKKKRKDRKYEHDEILKMLSIGDERMKVVILLLASSGIGIGAIPSLCVKHLQDRMLTVYEHDKEEYVTFVTGECRKAIDSYLDMRSRYGEKVTEESLLIREQFDVRCPGKPRPIERHSIQYKLYDLAGRAGIDKNDIAVAHGFRKFFTSQLVDSDVRAEIREMLLGHKIGLASCYHRPTIEQLWKEYEKAENNLIIDPNQRLQKKIEKLEVEKSEYQDLAAEIDLIKKKLTKSR
jgi:site-specific recombinase XerD